MPTVPQGQRVIDVASRPTAPDAQGSFAGVGQALVESVLPGASDVAAVRDSYLIGRQIGPAVREGRYGDAIKAFLASTTAAIGAAPMVPSMAGVIKSMHGIDVGEIPAFTKPELSRLVGPGGGLEEVLPRLAQLGPGHALRHNPTHPGVYYVVREPAVAAPAAPGPGGPASFVFQRDAAQPETVEQLASRVTAGVNDRAGLGDRGAYVYDNNSILLDSALDPAQRHHTLTHELGHAMAAKGGVVGPRGLAWQAAPPGDVLEQIRNLSRGRRPTLWGTPEQLENAFPHAGAAAIQKYRERPDELAADLVASMIADPAKAKEIGPDAYRWAADRLNASDLGKIAKFLGVPLLAVTTALARGAGLEPEGEAPPPKRATQRAAEGMGALGDPNNWVKP
jgi:hypothetical protein